MAYLSFVLNEECRAQLLATTAPRFKHVKCEHVTVALDWLPYFVYAAAAAEMNRLQINGQVVLFANPLQTKFDHQAEVMLVTMVYAPSEDFQKGYLWYQRTISPDRVYHVTHSLNDGCAPKLGKEVARLWPQVMDIPSAHRSNITSIREFAKANGWVELSGKFISAT